MKKLSICALMTSLCLVLSYVEHLIPLSVIIPVPGIKLGLSNIVLLILLLCYGPLYSFLVMFLKCLLSSFFFGSVTSLAFSVMGGVMSMTVMYILTLTLSKRISLFGISVSGAVFHNIGQLTAATLFLKTTTVFSYLPVLTVSGVVLGLLTATVAASALKLLGYSKGKLII